MRIYVRVTDLDGTPYEKKAITRRRKNVARSWWNKEWFARTLGLMQSLETTDGMIEIGSGKYQVAVGTSPMTWECPVAIDYEALQRVGDFQEEMAALRYIEIEVEVENDEDSMTNDRVPEVETGEPSNE